MGEGTKSVRYVSQSLSKSSRTRLLVFSTTFCGASSACACVNMRFFFPLFDARSSYTSSSTSTCRCPWTAAYSSSSSASPARRRNDEPNARLGARGRGDIVRLLVEELVVEPELELPLPTVIRPLCRRNICFLFYDRRCRLG